jgi:hypothetical protein
LKTHGATEFGNPDWEVGEGTGKQLDIVVEVLEGGTVPVQGERIWLSLESSVQPILYPLDAARRRSGGGRDDGVSPRLERYQVRVPHGYTRRCIHRSLALLVDSIGQAKGSDAGKKR